MKLVLATTAGVTAVLAFAVGTATGTRVPDGIREVPRVTSSAPIAGPLATGRPAVFAPHTNVGARGVSTAALNEVVRRYCGSCHSADYETRKGNMTLVDYNVDSAASDIAVAEKIIRKMRADMMPPPGSRRPGGDTLVALVETMEQIVDKASRPNPGDRPFPRLNRPEYERAIADLLKLEVNAGDWLPLDQMSANFDNIADVQALSPTLLDSYLAAAGAISRMAVGTRNAPMTISTYKTSPFSSQHPWEHVEGTPYGTRGGLVVTHTFLADGMYQFRLDVGGGRGTRLEDLDVSVDGKRVALLHYERGLESSLQSADAFNGADFIRTEFLPITAGQHKVSAAFVRRTEGPYEDLVKPNGWSQASNGSSGDGSTEPPKVTSLAVVGPNKITGISDNPTRQLIFSCKPAGPAEERPCAQSIVSKLGRRAYRRSLSTRDVESLMGFYDRGAATGGFEEGVRLALQAILASPRFVFKIETMPPNVAPGQDFKISDVDLASRLSFFLWGSIPDEELLSLAEQGKLSDPKTLEKQARRMLADPRTPKELSVRFGAQWLRLQDVEKVRPDAFFFPDYSERVAELMRTETKLFFEDLVRGDRNILDLYTAKYTFLNSQLAAFYGIPGVAGEYFRRVDYPDDTRRGILGQGTYLVQTSLGNRTSPVLRGKWVMEVLIGMPPPPPPPFVPDLEVTDAGKNGRPLTTRERTEIHRENPTCKTCHMYMDPIGLAVDNFDVTGRVRYRENLMPLDTRGTLYDGTEVSSAAELSNALVRRPIPLMRTFAENLMAYATGRRMEDFDQPAIRAITKSAEQKGYKMSSFVLGVVNSQAFRYRRAEAASADEKGK